MFEIIDSWKGNIRGREYLFSIEKLTDAIVNINCCVDMTNNEISCLAYEVPPGMSRAQVEAHFENDPVFLATWGKDT